MEVQVVTAAGHLAAVLPVEAAAAAGAEVESFRFNQRDCIQYGELFRKSKRA